MTEPSFAPRNVELGVAFAEVLERFMDEQSVSPREMAAIVLGTAAGGALERGETVKTFTDDAADMYARVSMLRGKMGRH